MANPIIDVSMIDGANVGSGGDTYSPTYSGGAFQNGKYVLNGKGYLSVPTPFMSGTGKWTVALKIDAYSPSSNTYSRFARGNNDVPSLFYTKSAAKAQAKLAYGSANTSSVTIVNDTNVSTSSGAILITVPKDDQTLFVFRNDGEYITLWINGIKTLQEASSRYTSDKYASTFSVGDDAGGSYYMSSLECSMLKLWDDAISDKEIIQLSGLSIVLVNKAQAATNGATSCTVAMSGCTPGNMLLLAYAIRGDGNDPSLSDGWTKLGGGNNVDTIADTNQRLFFAYKIADGGSETITITQSTTGRIYAVASEYFGATSAIIRKDLAAIGTANYTVTGAKTNAEDIMVYGVTSAYYGSGQGQTVTPTDLTKIEGDSSAERLACWFDDGSGATSHTFQTYNATSNCAAVLECVQLSTYYHKYLIRSGTTIYTITDSALTALTETEITASLLQTYGVDEIPDGALLVGLTDPEVLYWHDSTDELPTLILTVKGTPPLPQMFTSEPMDLTHESIAGINYAEVDASEDVRFAVSFDGGTTWKAFDGAAWFEVSDTAPGMLASTMNAITAEQWAEIVVLDSYQLRFWLPNVTAYVASVVMHYINP